MQPLLNADRRSRFGGRDVLASVGKEEFDEVMPRTIDILRSRSSKQGCRVMHCHSDVIKDCTAVERQGERTILVWGHRTERPEPTCWNIGPSHAEQTAAVWPSLRHAINYAIGMRADREAAGLHPWIRTPQGHVYSPVTIELMAVAMSDADGRKLKRVAA